MLVWIQQKATTRQVSRRYEDAEVSYYFWLWLFVVGVVVVVVVVVVVFAVPICICQPVDFCLFACFAKLLLR